MYSIYKMVIKKIWIVHCIFECNFFLKKESTHELRYVNILNLKKINKISKKNKISGKSFKYSIDQTT